MKKENGFLKGKGFGKNFAAIALAVFAGMPAFAQDAPEDNAAAQTVRTQADSRYGFGGLDFGPAKNVFSEMTYSATFGWYSRYVCEGIDCWDTGYFVGTLGANYDDRWFFRVWYGVADGHNNAGDRCGETKLRVDYKIALGSLSLIPWFEQSFIHQDREHGIPRPGLKSVFQISEMFSAGTDFYWQDNDGATGERGKFRGYYAVFANAHYDLLENLGFDANIRYGYNGGYVQRAPRGSNAMDYTLSATWKITDWCAVDAMVAYSQALTALRHEDLGDEFYGGLSLRFTY